MQRSTVWVLWSSSDRFEQVGFTRTNWGARWLKRRLLKQRERRQLPYRQFRTMERWDDPNL